ncbi:MAG: tRNA (N(6)-L-threonylcarbamoyladenosine(37)-C(2))-methylthiotransferase [Nanoarchaeota archaeon]
MKVFIKTYGCQANIADSEQIAGTLSLNGHVVVDSEKESDVVVVNSCSVKNATQSKVLQYIKSRDKKVFVGGCLTKTINIKKLIPNVTAVFDTNSISSINNVIENEADVFSNLKENRILTNVIRADRNTGVIAIGEGCLNKCTFCATKLSRGSLRSYRVGDIKRAVKKAVNDGCKIIYLTSQDNGCYGFDIKTSLPELLNEIISIDGDFEVRVGMMNPWHVEKILSDLVNVYKSSKIKKFIHIPVQSGSEKVLLDMKRVHTVDTFKKIARTFRISFPDITIATDVIVGYPTESEKDFRLTFNLINEIKPEVLNISMFSSRNNTSASELTQLPSQIIKERSKRITQLFNSYRLA